MTKEKIKAKKKFKIVKIPVSDFKIHCPYHGKVKTKTFGIYGAAECEQCVDEHNAHLKQEIVEEIDKELIKILKVSKTADDYHIGIAYVIDTFLTP